MTWAGLIIAVIATIVIVELIRRGAIPAPWHWVGYAIVLIVWLFVLLSVTNITGRIGLNERVGSLQRTIDRPVSWLLQGAMT